MDRLTEKRAGEILEAARDIRVLVVGDVMLDRYLRGLVERISPEAPVPVVRVDGEDTAVGGAANVAANVVALGAHCELVGCVGDDGEGIVLRRELEAMRVGVRGVVSAPERPTTVKTRVLARRQQVVRYDREEEADIGEEAAEQVLQAISALARECRVVALEDYNKGMLTAPVIEATLSLCGREGLPTVVDPKRRNFFAYREAHVFKPNAHELHDALGEVIRPHDPAWLERVRSRLGCTHLLLTLGDEGMALQSEGGEHLRVPAVARSVYDVSGAGDTVVATVSVALGAGATPAEAAVLANYAAAIEVGKAGVDTVSPDEILEEVRRYEQERSE